MKRRILILAVLLLVGGAYLWYRSRPGLNGVVLHRHQEFLVQMLQALPEPQQADVKDYLARQQPDWEAQLDRFQSGSAPQLTASLQMHMQVAVQPQLKPVPIVEGQLQSVLAQPPLSAAPPLTPERRALLLRFAASVGRLEVKSGADYSLRGTGFVVAPGLVATNCHVVRTVAQQGPSPVDTFLLAPVDLRIDFGDTPAHQERLEFRITALRPCPGEGLDVAFLQTEFASVDRHTTLPPPLILTSAEPQRLAAGSPLNVAQIGYPDLHDPNLTGGTPTQDLFLQFDAGQYAKFYTPGAITTVEAKSGIDFVFHIVSTWSGESGSPLLDLETGNVVAVDSCCDRTNGSLPAPSDLSCATRLLVSPANLGIGGWSVVRDPVLGAMLPRS